MLSCTYEVVAIDGDYAHLRRNDIEPEDNEMKLLADPRMYLGCTSTVQYV